MRGQSTTLVRVSQKKARIKTLFFALIICRRLAFKPSVAGASIPSKIITGLFLSALAKQADSLMLFPLLSLNSEDFDNIVLVLQIGEVFGSSFCEETE